MRNIYGTFIYTQKLPILMNTKKYLFSIAFTKDIDTYFDKTKLTVKFTTVLTISF